MSQRYIVWNSRGIQSGNLQHGMILEVRIRRDIEGGKKIKVGGGRELGRERETATSLQSRNNVKVTPSIFHNNNDDLPSLPFLSLSPFSLPLSSFFLPPFPYLTFPLYYLPSVFPSFSLRIFLLPPQLLSLLLSSFFITIPHSLLPPSLPTPFPNSFSPLSPILFPISSLSVHFLVCLYIVLFSLYIRLSLSLL